METRTQHSLYQNRHSYSDSGSSNGYDEDNVDESEAILASVREQEEQFAKLTQEIEAERSTVAYQLQATYKTGNSLKSISDTEESFPWTQQAPQSVSQLTDHSKESVHSQSNSVDNTLEILQNSSKKPKFHEEGTMNSDNYFDANSGGLITERTTRTEETNDPEIENEVVIGEDGVARTVTKKTFTKTVTTHTTRRIEQDDSLPRNGSPYHENGYPNDRGSYRSDRSLPRDSNPGSYRDGSLRRHDRESPVPQETTAFLSQRSSTSSENIPPSYDNRYARPDPPQQALTPEKFQAEDYGLEDDRRSDDDDDNEQYLLEPNTKNRYREYDGESQSSASSTSNRYPEVIDTKPSKPIAAPRDVRAPLACQEAGSRDSLNRAGGDWKNPSLEEVIKMLTYPMDVVQQNAAAYIQHLCFNDNNIKANVRRLGGIPLLVRLLDHPKPKVELNACGALRNLCYGPQNTENKIAIKRCEGVPALVRLVRESRDPEIKEQATGTLWNLSAHHDLKGQILELGLEILVSLVVIPYSDLIDQPSGKPAEIEMSDVFTNTVGIIRNLSSTDSKDIRQRLRDCEGLINALIRVLRINLEKGEGETKASENCICVLRNLTFKLSKEIPNALQYEVEPTEAKPQETEASCFGGKKSKKDDSEDRAAEIPPSDLNAQGAELLWQPDVVRMVLSLLDAGANSPDIIEACAGTIQNLSSGNLQWALYTRAIVRKEKGLPIFVDRLRTDNDSVIRAITIALSNLSLDSVNKNLIGKYAMSDLVYKVPGGNTASTPLSDSTYIALLNTVRIVVDKHVENARSLQELGGIEKVTTINNSRDTKYHPRVIKAAGQVLQALWGVKPLHSSYKKQGWTKAHFTPTITAQTLPRNAPSLNNKRYDESTNTSSLPSRGKRQHEKNQMEMKDKNEYVDAENGKKGTTDSWV